MAKVIWTILKGAVYLTVIAASMALIIYACCSCGKKTTAAAADQPKQYDGRWKNAGNDYFLHTYIDTETGICYAVTTKGGICVMLDHDGKPYVANGWRDYDE